MINVLTKREAPRDTTKLSPHSHDDFEQASLLLEGQYVHHMRYPWTTDMADWREDEHLEVGSPSVIVIPLEGGAYQPQRRRRALLADRHLRPAAHRLLDEAGPGAQCRRISDACGDLASVMKSVEVRAPGGPEVLTIVDAPMPRLGPARC